MRDLYLVVLRCRDIEKTKAFYEHFGMAFQLEQHGNGPKHYAHDDEGGVLELYPATGSADQTGLGFTSTDIEGLNKRLKLGKYAPRDVRATEMGRQFVVLDPDGRRVEVTERTESTDVPA